MKFIEIQPEAPIVHVVPTPWDSAVDNLTDDDLVDIENWDDKTSTNKSPVFNTSRHAAIASFETRNRKQRYFA